MGLRGDRAHLFNTSPKAWMNTGPAEGLAAEILPGTQVTPKHLLAGLLAQAFSAAQKALPSSARDLTQFGIRVAHPVWDAERATQLQDDLAWITSCAIQLAGATDRPVAPDALVVRVEEPKVQQQRQEFDVVEPIAAALQLFENSENSRELCVVIDVGAGSTDMAIFLSLTPDATGYRRKFIRAGPPRSVYIAGDFIDSEVVGLIRSRAVRIKSEDLQSIELRRRRLKETLFSRAGKIVEAGVEITLHDLEGQQGIRKMRQAIADAFHQMIAESSGFISTFVTASVHRADQLNVIFAGGGSNISFLHSAIGKSVEVRGQRVPIRIRAVPTPPRTLPASLERLAVALGGTIPARHWPVTSMQPGEWTTRRRSLL